MHQNAFQLTKADSNITKPYTRKMAKNNDKLK